MQRSEYWLKVERLRARTDRKYTAIFNDILWSEVEAFARMVEKEGPQAAMSGLAAVAWNDKMMAAMNKMYKEVAVTFGNSSYRAVGIESRKAYDPFDLNALFLQEIINFLMRYGFYIVSLITQTTKKKLIEWVNKSLQAGYAVDGIIGVILSKEAKEYIYNRAVMIARTEVMRASNYSMMVGANEHPFEVDKMWVSMRDARTRRIPKDMFDHWDMDGQTKSMNEPFISADKLGRTIVADMPGDPTSPRGFTINCRCTVAYIPRKDANGQLIMKR